MFAMCWFSFLLLEDPRPVINESFNSLWYRNLRALIKGEVLLYLSYVIGAFIFTCLYQKKTYSTIGWIWLVYWSIEITCDPFLIGYLAFLYVELVDSLLIFYRPVEHIFMIVIYKLPMFIVMRYAEMDPDWILNDLRAALFYWICNSSDYRMPDSNPFHLAARRDRTSLDPSLW
jgi:hypothetical protein